MDLSQYLTLFLDECRQRVRQSQQVLLKSQPDRQDIDDLFRQLHTIKGMAATMGYETIAALTHELENAMVAVREGERLLDRNLRLTIKEGLEQIKYDLNALEKGKPLVPALRVRSDVLDDLLENLGELYSTNQQLQNAIQQGTIDKLTALSHHLSTNLAQLHERIMAMRLTPISFITERLPETIGDLAKKLGKEVDLTIDGEELEIDRAVLEAIDNPLTQLLRNALDHGLESPEERCRAGKNPRGHLTLTIKRVEHHLEVTVSDDGRGIDVEKLQARALKKGLISEEKLAKLDHRGQLFLCCLPGLSTADQLSAISGRGVGMDLVKAQLESLGGHFDITSEKGHGTTFILEFPLSLALVQALLVEINHQQFAVPMWQLTGTTIIENPTGDSRCSHVLFREKSVPLTDLKKILFPNVPAILPPCAPALIIENGGQYKALAVDRIFQTRELVLKPLCNILTPLNCYCGVAISDNGMPLLVLDIFKLAVKVL